MHVVPGGSGKRWVVWIVVGCVAAVAVAGAVTFLGFRWKERQRMAASAREARQVPLVEVAPAPLPAGLPLLGSEDRDADGYPLQYVDRAALRSLLWHRRHADLSRYFEELQTAFEADPRREYQPIDAADTFASAEPKLAAALDAWVVASPRSFAPYLARGTYWDTVAGARRGTRIAIETPRADFDAMRETLSKAHADLDRAIEIRPTLVAAYRRKLLALRGESEAREERRVIDRALAICPTCFQVRVTYLYSLTPRWGGSYEAMTQFARASPNAEFSKLRVLPGYVDLDRADVLARDGDLDGALAAIERARTLGEHWEFLLKRGVIQRLRSHEMKTAGGVERSLADVDRALALRPGHPEVFLERAVTYNLLGKRELAGRDLLALLRADPTDSRARDLHQNLVEGLIYEGWTHHQAGRRDDALRVYDLGAELAPTNRELQQRRAWVVLGDAGAPSSLAALEQAVANEPDNFRAHQQLDYAYSKQGVGYEKIVSLWSRYLERHRDDGAAYLERGGAYFNLGKRAEAIADARRACELGVSRGCALAEQHGAK